MSKPLNKKFLDKRAELFYEAQRLIMGLPATRNEMIDYYETSVKGRSDDENFVCAHQLAMNQMRNIDSHCIKVYGISIDQYETLKMLGEV